MSGFSPITFPNPFGLNSGVGAPPAPSSTSPQPQAASSMAGGGADESQPPSAAPPGYVWVKTPVYGQDPNDPYNTHAYLGTQWQLITDRSYQTPGSGGGSAASLLAAEKASTPEERLRLAQLAADTQRADTASREQQGIYDTQATLGDKLLNELITLKQDPAAGPLGLLAFGAYGGGAQNVAAGTGGAGIASPYSSLLDTLLGSLSSPFSGANSTFNSIGGGASGTEKIQPNKAPGLTPESAAGAPDARQAMIDAWNAYHPDNPYQDPNAPNASVAPKPVLNVPGAAAGAQIPLPSGAAHPLATSVAASPAAKILARAKTLYVEHGGHPGDYDRIISTALQGVHQQAAASASTAAAPVPGSPPAAIPGFADGGLEMLASAGLDTPEKVQQALAHQNSAGDPLANAINQYGQSDLARKAMTLASGGLEGSKDASGNWAVGDNGSAFGPYQIHPDTKGLSMEDALDPYKSTERMSNDYNLAAERVQRENPGLFESDPAQAAALTAFYAESPAQMYDPNRYRQIWSQVFGVPGAAEGAAFGFKSGTGTRSPLPVETAPNGSAGDTPVTGKPTPTEIPAAMQSSAQAAWDMMSAAKPKKTVGEAVSTEPTTQPGLATSLSPKGPMNPGSRSAVTIGGEPHWIVDNSGNRVAALTEDGKPETVHGLGGVEVVPEDPIRKAAYFQRRESAKRMGRMFSDLATPAKPVMAATGVSALFPAQTVSNGQVTPETTGGPTTDRQSQIGGYFKSVVDPATGQMSMPSEATDATTANDPQGYAKILGGALSSGNTAVPSDWLQALNGGKAPDKLLTTEEFNTLLPSQQKGYLSLLQQMGLGNPEDIMAQMKQFEPAALK